MKLIYIIQRRPNEYKLLVETKVDKVFGDKSIDVQLKRIMIAYGLFPLYAIIYALNLISFPQNNFCICINTRNLKISKSTIYTRCNISTAKHIHTVPKSM